MSPTPRLGASGKCNGLDSFFDSKNTVSPPLIIEGSRTWQRKRARSGRGSGVNSAAAAAVAAAVARGRGS
jgi:hypothetical protein